MDGDEGQGTPVWCPSEVNNIRIGIKLNQHKLHDRLLQYSAKKFHPASIGDNVTIPIEKLFHWELRFLRFLRRQILIQIIMVCSRTY